MRIFHFLYRNQKKRRRNRFSVTAALLHRIHYLSIVMRYGFETDYGIQLIRIDNQYMMELLKRYDRSINKIMLINKSGFEL